VRLQTYDDDDDDNDGAKNNDVDNDGDGATGNCENIPTWVSLSGDLAFSHQDGIYGFNFLKRFSELS